MTDKTLTIPIVKVNQPIGEFYVAVMKSERLYKLAYADIISINQENSENTSQYFGIQRPLRTEKIKAIVNYLKSENATFPNSIIVNIDSNDIVSKNDNELCIKKNTSVFSILDGQHRLEGLHEANMDIDVIVSIFPGLSNDLQNEVFDTINSEQTKVNPSITIYKQSQQQLNTPRKFASKLAVSFALDDKTVWFQKIKLVGTKDELSPYGSISLQAFYKPIVNLIYDDDKFSVEIANELSKKNNFPKNLNTKYGDRILWEFYVNQDLKSVYRILNNFFNALSEQLNRDFNNPKSLMQKTTGYNATMMLFKHLFLSSQYSDNFSYNFFETKLSGLEKLNGSITSDNYKSSGDQSAKELYQVFLNNLNL